MNPSSAPTFSRALVIGDVHGCVDELLDLVRLAGFENHGNIICVGDLIIKGPNSRAVLDWAMSDSRIQCVRGNHEDRILRYASMGQRSTEKTDDLDFYEQVGSQLDSYISFMSRWPLYIETPDFAVVHGGIDASRGWLNEQTDRDLLTLRDLPLTRQPWYETYTSQKLILFGHWAKRHPVIRDNAIGLDTGCVYGARLTGYITDEKRIVSIPARKTYKQKKSW